MLSTTVNIVLVMVALLIWMRTTKSAPLHPDLQFLLDTMPKRPSPPSTLTRRNSEATLPVQHPPSWGITAVMKKVGSEADLGKF